MTDAIRATRTHTPSIDDHLATNTPTPTRAAGNGGHPVHRSGGSPARASDSFGSAPTRNRSLDRAMGAGRPATSAESAIQSRIALDSRRFQNLGAIQQRMQSLTPGPSYEAHRNDVPYAPPLEDAIREQQSEMSTPENLVEVGRSEARTVAAEHALEQGFEHTVLAGVGGALGIVAAQGHIAEYALESLHAGDARYAAAQARQSWEDHQSSVDSHIAQGRADGRAAVRAADVANTSDPVTIDWNRFQTDGDYAEGVRREVDSEMGAARGRMTADRSLLSSAQQLSPQIQAMFPWLVGGEGAVGERGVL